MKILVLTHSYPRHEGDVAAPFVKDLCVAQAAAGDEVTVVAPFDSAMDDRQAGSGIRLLQYRYVWPSRCHLLGYSRTLGPTLGLRPWVPLLAPFMLVAAFFKLWVVVWHWRPDVIHAHWIVPNGFVAALVSRLSGVPLCVTLHGSDVAMAARGRGARFMSRLAASSAACITSCSDDLSARLQRAIGKVVRCNFVPNGSFGHRFVVSAARRAAMRRRIGVTGDELLICALGRLIEVKGFDILVDAASQVLQTGSGVRFVLAGSGDLGAKLRERVQHLEIERRFTFVGALTFEEVPDYLAAADIVVVPSRYDAEGNSDGLPVVVVEAMAAGRAIVASKIGGIPSVIVDRESGLLIAPGDADALADAILSLSTDQSLRERFGRRAQDEFRATLDWTAIARRHRAHYEAICRPPGVQGSQ